MSSQVSETNKEELEYFHKVSKLVEEMMSLSNKGMKQFSGNEFLVLCGTIRDCAFKIKKILEKKI